MKFVVVHNEFLFSYLVLRSEPQEWGLLLYGLFRAGGVSGMAAANIVGIVPMVALVALAQDRIVSGLTRGALKE
nr:hypothetical protein [Natronomonas sp.]